MVSGRQLVVVARLARAVDARGGDYRRVPVFQFHYRRLAPARDGAALRADGYRAGASHFGWTRTERQAHLVLSPALGCVGLFEFVGLPDVYRSGRTGVWA